MHICSTDCANANTEILNHFTNLSVTQLCNCNTYTSIVEVVCLLLVVVVTTRHSNPRSTSRRVHTSLTWWSTPCRHSAVETYVSPSLYLKEKIWMSGLQSTVGLPLSGCSYFFSKHGLAVTIRDAESLFFCGTLTPTPAVKNLDSDSGRQSDSDSRTYCVT